MNQIVVIADDLTGAADAGVQFCPYFDNTMLVSYLQFKRSLETSLPASTLATALYTNSRALEADTARERLVCLAQGLVKKRLFRIYKKIDSCMRGNVGSEVDALLDGLNYELSFITPAFPEMGRTTTEDIHRVHGIPLNQTEIARDPVTPVAEARLSGIVAAKSRYPVAHIALSFVEGDSFGIEQEIERHLQDGVRHIVFDATCRVHLDRIAKMIFSLRHRILPVGSAGLAGSLAALLPSKAVSHEHIRNPAPEGFNLLICGTASEVTRRQIKELLKSHSYAAIGLTPEILADKMRREEFLNAVSAVQSSLLQKNVILTIRPQNGSRTALQQTDREPAADSIVRGLGRFVAHVAASCRPGRLFLTGGDTADAVLSAIEVEGTRILGQVAAGVVQGVLIGGLLDGTPVVTKAGAFGQDDTLVVLHEFWKKEKDSSEIL